MYQVFDAETLQVWIGEEEFVEYRLDGVYSPLCELYDLFATLLKTE